MAQALDRLPNGFVGQSPGRQPLLEDHIRQEVQRPGAPGLAEAAWGLVEDAFEGIGLGLVEDRLRVLGTAFLFVQAADAFRLKGVEGVADGSDGAPDLRSDPRRSLALGAGQEDLGASEGERLATAESGPERQALGVGQFSNEQRWFHDPLFGPITLRTSNRMRLH